MLCDRGSTGRGGREERAVEAREGELRGGRRAAGVAGEVEMLAGGSEASEEERGASGEAEGASRAQGQEMDQDGQPDRQVDGVLGVAEEPW